MFFLKLKLLTIFFLLLFAFNANANKYDIFEKEAVDESVAFSISEKDKTSLSKIEGYIKERKLNKALSIANEVDNSLFKDSIQDYILWVDFSYNTKIEESEKFSPLISFIDKNEFLPNINELRKKAERIYLENDIPISYAMSHFDKYPPLDAEVYWKVINDKIEFLENSNELIKSDRGKIENNLKDDIKRIWMYKTLNFNIESQYIEKYKDTLTEKDFIDRIEMLIWSGLYSSAERIIDHLELNYRVLYKNTIKILKRPKSIKRLYKEVSRSLRNNELLLFARMKYYHKTKNYKNAMKILLFAIKNEIIKMANEWSIYQLYYSREMHQEKNYKKAYYISSNHKLNGGGVEYARLEWFSGWIALRYLKKERTAYNHFINMYNNVSYPSSLAKASYWAGFAKEEDNKDKKAIEWYKKSSQYPTHFYGQISISKMLEFEKNKNLSKEHILPEIPKINEEDIEYALNNRIAGVAFINDYYNKSDSDSFDIYKFAINNAKSNSQIAALIELSRSMKSASLRKNILKHSSYKNVFFVQELYPFVKLLRKDDKNYTLIHALMKQESGFNVTIKSPVGAIGLMQVMPNTAKNVAKRMKIPYSLRNLTYNPEYNIKIGSYYINWMLEKWNGSEVLAMASYNAGPNAAKRWIKEFGDPRDYKKIDDVIDWIESISYYETRNYVKKLLENSVVYKFRLSDKENKEK